MMPPICELCDRRFGPDQGGLVSFAMRDGDRAWQARCDAEPGFVGHPPWQAWFCGAHVDAAAAREGLTIDRAMAELRALDAEGP